MKTGCVWISSTDEPNWHHNLGPADSFILGAADGLAIGNDICPPAQGWSLIAPRVVRKYIRDHPEKLGTSGGILVYWALIAEFPCRRR